MGKYDNGCFMSQLTETKQLQKISLVLFTLLCPSFGHGNNYTYNLGGLCGQNKASLSIWHQLTYMKALNYIDDQYLTSKVFFPLLFYIPLVSF